MERLIKFNKRKSSAMLIRPFASLMGCLVVGSSPAVSGDQAADPLEQEARELSIRAVETETMQGIPGASISVRSMVGLRWTRSNTRTDRAGNGVVRWPVAEWDAVRVVVLAPGYEPAQRKWNLAEVSSRTLTVGLHRAITGGGRVLNKAGDPVAQAQVFIHSGIPSSQPLIDPEELHFETTDAAGQWTCSHLPQRLDTVKLWVLHPDYAAGRFDLDRGSGAGFKSLPSSPLRSESAVILLKRGFEVNGRVLDAEGQPIEGARITGGDYPVWTPFDGRFSLPNCRRGSISVLVQAKGYTPNFETIEAAPGMPELALKLARSPALRLHLIDSSSRPVRGAWLWVEQWSAPVPSEWSWRSDMEGRLVWDSAPTNEIVFAIRRAGYKPVNGLKLSANGKEQSVVLRRTLTVSGRVIDAATRQPVSAFRVVPGRFHADHHHWELARAVEFSSGPYTIDLPGDGLAHALKVEAEAYYAEVSHAFREDEEEASVDFLLARGEPISGTVLLANGEPAAGAHVAFITEKKGVLLGKAKFGDHDQSNIVQTDGRGRFQFAPQRAVEFWVAVHEKGGVAQREAEQLRQAARIVLQPWARLEGTLRSRQIPQSNRLVGLRPLGAGGLVLPANEFTALTDGLGNFVLDKVPTGRHLLGQVIESQLSHGRAVEVKPGATTRVALNYSGHALIGHLKPEPTNRLLNWEGQPAWLRRKQPALTPPDFQDDAARRAWWRRFWNSDEGQARQIATAPYVVRLESSGAFRVRDVPPGDYELEIHYHDPRLPGEQGNACHGIHRRDLALPAVTENGQDTPFDLGAVEFRFKNGTQRVQ